MNKLLDVLVVVVVFIFATLLVLTIIKTCGKTKPEEKNSLLESSVIMGEENDDADSASLNEVSEAWDEIIERNDTARLEADGIAPEAFDDLDPEVVSKISEHGDEGIKKEKKDQSPPDKKEEPKVNVSPGGDSFLVIVGSFKDPVNADNLVKKLKDYGYPAEVVQFLNNNLKSVTAQRFASKEEANRLVGELKSKYKISSYVVKKTDR